MLTSSEQKRLLEEKKKNASAEKPKSKPVKRATEIAAPPKRSAAPDSLVIYKTANQNPSEFIFPDDSEIKRLVSTLKAYDPPGPAVRDSWKSAMIPSASMRAPVPTFPAQRPPRRGDPVPPYIEHDDRFDWPDVKYAREGVTVPPNRGNYPIKSENFAVAEWIRREQKEQLALKEQLQRQQQMIEYAFLTS
ncbi:unnamed protein product [Gongylonema pulchrum]|uniref:Uncharacterized protein n=1 Tax=Gongylonema pulchrum TaxID=637853 RepID=A0A3P7M656_9BILA|nr:unnamed protein product [Gongylonema pulchrum]